MCWDRIRGELVAAKAVGPRHKVQQGKGEGSICKRVITMIEPEYKPGEEGSEDMRSVKDWEKGVEDDSRCIKGG